MAKIVKSSHPTKRYSNGGVVSGVPEAPVGSMEWLKQKANKAASAGIETLRKATQSQESKDAEAATSARQKQKAADETLMYGKPLRK
jgi:hypothetical protein